MGARRASAAHNRGVTSHEPALSVLQQARCRLFQSTLQLMKVWGLGDKPQADGRRRFLDVTVPEALEHVSARKVRTAAPTLANQTWVPLAAIRSCAESQWWLTAFDLLVLLKGI